MERTPQLRHRLRPLLLIGLPVGLLRYAYDFARSESSMYFGVYYVMPVVLLVIGLRDRWGPIRWRALAGTMLLTALIVWGVPNTLAYTTGQFLEWQHGRFFHDPDPAGDGSRAAPIAATALGKLGWGIAQGLLTSVAGAVWCTIWGTLVVWLPGRLRKRV